MRLTASVFTAAMLATGMLSAAQLASPATASAASGVVRPADEDTASQNLLRDGWDPNEPGLSPATVSGGTFGKLFDTPVNGQVYAQPLVVDNTSAGTSSVLVATENDWVYSLDGETGAVNWKLSLGTPWPASVTGCTDLTPNIGVTSTPVYQPPVTGTAGTLYVTAVVNDGLTQSAPDIYLYAINAQTGAVRWKVPVKGAPVNDPTHPFNPLTERQRTGLMLLNGSVYMAFASYCDFSPYAGYVVGVNTTTKAQTMWSDEAGLTDKQGGIWMGGSGLMADDLGPSGQSRIFLVTGNGVSPAPGPGNAPPAELGDSVVQLAVTQGGSLAAQQFFSPANAPTLDANDTDFGAGGAVGLPFGTSTYPDLMVAVGKDGRLFVLNRDGLGGRGASSDNVLSVNSSPYGGEWGRPAAFAGDGGADYVYYVGNTDNLRALQFDATNPAAPVLTDVANSTGIFGFSSGSPAVTSNGTDPTSAVVWEVYAPHETGVGGTLEAFNAIPQPVGPGNALQMQEIWSAPIGTASKFTVPATADGRVYVGTRDGAVLGFGSPDSAPVNMASTAFGQVAVGKSKTVKVTVTVPTTVSSVKISGVSAGSGTPFSTQAPTQNGSPVALPVTLTGGQTLSVPVVFKPVKPGGFTGSLVITTATPNFKTVTAPLTADGVKTGLYTTQTALTFAKTPVGSNRSMQADIINGGAATVKVTAITGATSPFRITGLAKNTSIKAGGSVPVTVTFTPAKAGTFTGKLTFTATGGGTSAAVKLTAPAVTGQGVLTAPAVVKFGGVHLGQFASQTVTLTNAGNLVATVTGFTAPGVPFGTPTPIARGLPIGPGYSIALPVTFTPQSRGTRNGTYHITYTDGRTARTIVIPVTGTGTPPATGVAVPSPGGGWTFNGSAQMTGTTLQLTSAAQYQAGSALYYEPLASNGLTAQFTARLSGGTGADGMTFALLKPASGLNSVGGHGAMLGFGGLSGVAVVLGTAKDPGDPSGNFIGIATGTANGHFVFAATSTSVPNLRTATHRIGVTVSGGKIAVSVDGKRYLNVAVKLPGTVLPGFTAGTGKLTDIHAVSAVSLSSGTVVVPPPGGGWSYNGSAQMNGSGTELTQRASYQAGSVVYPRLVTSSGLHAQFSIQIGGGSGGEGMTFALLSPPVQATAVGAAGLGLGFTKLTGVAVAFNTFRQSGEPTADFAAIVSGANGTITYKQTAQEIGQLRAGTHAVSVTVQNGVLIVSLDGQRVLAMAVSLPKSVALAYTGGTDARTDIHLVRNAAISAASFG